jgi:hypothetical protein
MRSQFRRWRWNLGTEGMAAEDGPWFRGPSAMLGLTIEPALVMLHSSGSNWESNM